MTHELPERIWARRPRLPYKGRHRKRSIIDQTVTDSPAPAIVPKESSGQPLGNGHTKTAGAGVPRIAPYARIAYPQPDDTVFDLIPIPGRFQPSAGTVLGALGRHPWHGP